MPNIRIYELSKELGLSNKEVLEVARGMGIAVKSHSSSVSQEEAKKIKEEVASSGNGVISPKIDGEEIEEIKEKEEVKVIRSQVGEDIVRRRGDSVVIRRRRVEQPVKEEKKEEMKVKKAKAVEKESEAVPSHEVAEITEQVSEAEEKLSPVEEKVPEEELTKEAEKVEETLKEVVEEAIGTDKEEEDKEEKRARKKLRKAKRSKEEVIDEETLEELRRAFRTRLPGKRKEYLVDDRRSRARSNRDVDTGHKKFQRELGYTREKETEEQEARIIPFPKMPSKRVIKIGESIAVGNLAKEMSVKASDLIKKLVALGVVATINQSIDHETAEIAAADFGFEVEVQTYKEEEILREQEADTPDVLESRSPVVTVMGHVDHGKTTLLDAIRQTNVAETEAGGITQHIGAYVVNIEGKKVVFIDTPGHEAFTTMRARGAQATDIVILVVAAEDGVMPQSVEAINHARAAGVPLVVAINKIDKPEANPERVKSQLAEYNLVPEEWGGDTLYGQISAKNKIGIKELLELVLLQAEVLELKANPYKPARGVVIEARLDKGRGPIATVIIHEGTLKVGNSMVAGTNYGRVRALMNDRGERIEAAGLSMPVEVIGLSGVPSAGDKLYVVKEEKTAKEIVQHRELKEREDLAARTGKLSLEDLYARLKEGEVKELPLIIKADTDGSVEAAKEALTKLSSERCRINIIHSGVGAITETDVTLASASDAVIVGFNVHPDAKALEAAEKEGVSLELHSIIYDVVDRVKKAMEGLLEPVLREKIVGRAEVKATFQTSRTGTVAGCFVSDGKLVRGLGVRVLRNGSVVHDGKISSLKRFKDDVKEVVGGYECGVGVENFNDIRVGDRLEVYTFEEIQQTL